MNAGGARGQSLAFIPNHAHSRSMHPAWSGRHFHIRNRECHTLASLHAMIGAEAAHRQLSALTSKDVHSRSILPVWGREGVSARTPAMNRSVDRLKTQQ